MNLVETEELQRRIGALEAENARLRELAIDDNTELERAETALADSEQRYRTLFKSIDEGFCIIEFLDGPHGPLTDYVHVEANPAYAQHAGIPNVVGQKLREMVPDEADGWAELYGGVLRTGVPIRFERELVATGRHLELAAFRIEPASRRQVAVLFQDITARKRAEAALQHLNETLEVRIAEAIAERKHAEEALRQSQKMEAVGQLTGGIAHDFNNLLTGIIGSLELLETRLRQGRTSEIHRYVGVAQGASKRAAALTHRLLAFSRRQTLDRQADRREPAGDGHGGADPPHRRTADHAGGGHGRGPVVGADRCVAARKRAAQPLHQRARRDAGWRPHHHRDREQMARRPRRQGARPAAGAISVALRDRHRHRHDARRDRARVRSVLHHQADRPGHRPRAVDGLRLRAAVRRTGAHLFRSRMRHHDVPLPAAASTAVCPRSSPARAPAASARAPTGKTVLIVDDEPSVRMLVTEVLEDLGYALIEAADGRRGCGSCSRTQPIDLLVTDVGLPGGMNGRQLADAARITRPDLKVLFITGYAENAVIGNGQLAPGMRVLTKPFVVETLANRILEMIGDDKAG